jgi:tetratricopeptide (TPR) repeat protein
MYERELAATPDDPDLLLRAGKHFYYEAEIAISPDNDIPRAHDLLDRSEALLRRHIEVAGEDDEEGEISLIFTLNARSEIHMMENRLPDAATVLEAQIPRVLALLEAREARGDAPDENLMRLYNSSLRMLGQVYTYQNRALAAVEVLDKAVAHYPQIEALKPGDTYAMRGKVLAYSRRAYAHLMAGQLEPAIADYEVALAISRERMALEPNDEDTRFMYNAHRGELALALGQLGRFDEAEAIFLEGLAYQREQIAKNPDSAWNRRNLWVQHYQMVLHYQRAGQTDRMCTAFRDMTQVTAERVARNAMTETDTNGWTGVLAQYTPLCGEPPPG